MTKTHTIFDFFNDFIYIYICLWFDLLKLFFGMCTIWCCVYFKSFYNYWFKVSRSANVSSIMIFVICRRKFSTERFTCPKFDIYRLIKLQCGSTEVKIQVNLINFNETYKPLSFSILLNWNLILYTLKLLLFRISKSSIVTNQHHKIIDNDLCSHPHSRIKFAPW